MILPMTRQQQAEYERRSILMDRPYLPVSGTIRNCVNWLLSHLYYPDEEVGASLSEFWLDELGLHDIGTESINWGDLGCVEVRQYADGGGWEVFIEEAAPECPALQAYITKWLTAWGWTPVEVRTEW